MAEAETLMDVLPGVRLEVGAVTTALADMWQVEEAGSGNFRASQLNLILHFGMRTTPEEALERFQSAIRFAQRYPCRIIVLCPRPGEKAKGDLPVLEARLFTQCYIGATMREKCCCEALMLSYATTEFLHLRNQVSVWLEADLPVYHWFHRVPRERIETQYLDFVRPFQRVLFDSAVEGEGYAEAPWPRPERVSDLAQARLLPIKQTLGPFLAAYDPEALLEGLELVKVQVADAFRGEARCFAAWIEFSLQRCADSVAQPVTWETEYQVVPLKDGLLLEMTWLSAGSESLRCELSDSGQISIECRLGEVRSKRVLMIEWLPEETVLSEAIFF